MEWVDNLFGNPNLFYDSDFEVERLLVDRLEWKRVRWASLITTFASGKELIFTLLQDNILVKVTLRSL